MMNNHISYRFVSPAALRRSGAAFCAALGLAGASIVVALAAPKDGDSTLYTVQRSAKLGDIDRYKLAFKATIDAGPEFSAKQLQFTVNLKYKEVAKDVKGDGTMVLADTAEDAQLKNDQIEQDITSFIPVVTQSLDKQGALISITSEGANIPVAAGASFFINAVAQTQSAFYPPKPVKVGDTWKVEASTLKVNEQSIKSSSTGTLMGTETVNGVNTVKVKVVQDSDVSGKAAQKLHFEGTGNLDPRDGKFIKLVGVIDGKSGAIKKSEFTLTRVLNEDKAETKTDVKPASDAKPATPIKQ